MIVTKRLLLCAAIGLVLHACDSGDGASPITSGDDAEPMVDAGPWEPNVTGEDPRHMYMCDGEFDMEEPAQVGACTNNEADICIVGVTSWDDVYGAILEHDDHLDGFTGAPDPEPVKKAILAEGVTETCAECWAQQLRCANDHIIADIPVCVPACSDDPGGEVCTECQRPCFDAFFECSGLVLPAN